MKEAWPRLKSEMASEPEAIDEALNAALQRSQSTPEPLFGHLDFNNGQNQPNGKVYFVGKLKFLKFEQKLFCFW